MPTISPFHCFWLFLIFLLSAPVQAAPDINAQMTALLRDQQLTGAVWTTLDSEGAAGVSDTRTGKAMRADQRVHVGSVAKTVLAIGILRLVSQGLLNLETPVDSILPQMEFDNPWHATDPLRIRHLIDNTSGLDDVHFWHVFSTTSQPDAPVAAAFPQGSGLLRLRARPGARFSYSNMSYTLLGMIVEAVVKQRYERYLDKELLAPLGMRDSTFAFVSQAGDPRLAMGHFDDGTGHPAMPSYVRPASQFTTTAADMGRLARFLMSDGDIDGKPFIDTALLRQMGEPKGTEAAGAGLIVGYGLGLRKIDRHGVLAKCHGGNTIGFRAMLCIFPESQKAFFVAINADSETADYHRFDALLIDALSLAKPARAAVTQANFNTSAWQGFYIASPNRFHSMRFMDTVFNFVRVSKEASSLRFKPFQSAALTLSHVEKGLFRAPDKLQASHALLQSAEGAHIVSTGTQSYEKVPLTYMMALWTSVAAGLLGLVFIQLKGMVRLAQRRLSRRDALLPPFAGALALLLPIPLFVQQSFLQLGELTLASGTLAVVTAALPVCMLIGLALALRRGTVKRVESAAMLAGLQLSVVLAVWGLMPLRLWA